MKTDSSLAPYLSTFRRRLRLRDGWLLAQRTLWLALAATVVILLLGRFLPIGRLEVWEAVPVWALAPPAIWLCAVLGFGLFRPQHLMRVAQRVDLELELKERLSTALELESPVTLFANNPLPDFQHADALNTAQNIQPRQAFPLSWQRVPLWTSVGILAAALLLVYLPNPMDAVLAERAAVEQAALEQAEQIEELKEEIAQSTELSPEMQAELLRQLEELAQQLRDNPGDREKALADLSKLEENLRRQLNPNADLQQASLEAISAQLQALAQQENIDTQNLDLTAEALEKLAENLANLDESERAALAQALSEMAAQAAQSGDAALAQALAAMSQAAQAGDSAAGLQASGEAAQALAQAQSDLAAQNALQQALRQLQSSSQAVAQAGQSGQQMTGQQPGQGQQPGSGNNPGQGNSPGQGQSGQGMSGGGTKADTLPPGTSSGQARRPGQQDTGGATSELGEQVFIPLERRPSEGQEVSIPGQNTGQGETITRENPNPSGGLPGSALIPYQQVYTQYFQAAQQAIERAEIPLAYRDLVRDYFTQLEP